MSLVSPGPGGAQMMHGETLGREIGERLRWTIDAGLPDDLGIGVFGFDYENWLTEHFGGTNVDDSALAASGVHTIREAYIAGLNPTNAAARFVIQDLGLTAGDKVVSWPKMTGRVYNVYWSSNLLDGAGFVPIASNVTWNVGSYTDTVHRVSPNDFYRISVQLEE